ncbi:hypothetical protein GSU3571 [Geobacter sulfurreducens PCA]|uniref:Uncharacterized protein n=1 Tax=Geobacter sulfurreducens (strain ATCC 51573 / DSM 12127 / PCA) TaxID=243231 RepID=I7F9L4_GEOSL|nr:hypothetical protein KN400_3471 [Geobacter sulfurreducens KN400]AFP20469.1 hypothetical protein GSU3571 [Geobacter sulfurreducens PCA]AJY68576.1 hypothetical protein RW64_02685 [Geobacter sulfurreducens]HBB68708.1 hypothetical protein [Geobacter sulfurreducens]HCD94780.1 hypothetical protein [Geobacter sulfurreducens]
MHVPGSPVCMTVLSALRRLWHDVDGSGSGAVYPVSVMVFLSGSDRVHQGMRSALPGLRIRQFHERVR